VRKTICVLFVTFSNRDVYDGMLNSLVVSSIILSIASCYSEPAKPEYIHLRTVISVQV